MQVTAGLRLGPLRRSKRLNSARRAKASLRNLTRLAALLLLVLGSAAIELGAAQQSNAPDPLGTRIQEQLHQPAVPDTERKIRHA
jgi:hypothetical protein